MVWITMGFLMLMFSSIIMAGLMIAFVNDLIEKLWQLQKLRKAQKSLTSVIVLSAHVTQDCVQAVDALTHVTVKTSTSSASEAETLAKAA